MSLLQLDWCLIDLVKVKEEPTQQHIGNQICDQVFGRIFDPTGPRRSKRKKKAPPNVSFEEGNDVGPDLVAVT